jgi:glycosyltransferase involved in cell wall biosynthesis
MFASIYSPYLGTLGGGERYLMGVARVLLDLGYRVDLEWKDKDILPKLESRFGVDLSGVNIVDSIKRGRGYDFCFWLSDGSVPFLFAGRNFIHFQVPFKDVGGGSLKNRIKFLRINKVVVNSFFTKKFIDKEYKVNSVVLYPPVDVEAFKPSLKNKEKVILSVGRFSQLKQAKNQHILVEVFSRMYKQGFSDWKLILAGGSEVGGKDYVRKLHLLSRNLPVEIMENPDFREIKSLYEKASIFWSASGFGTDENKHPEKVEHFGITVVEAMASGTVPVVFNGGGHKEIVNHGKDGYLWNTEEELISFTKEVVASRDFRKLSLASIKKSASFSYGVFSGKITELIYEKG